MRPVLIAHIALFLVNLIYGASYSIAKEVMPEFILPFGFILLRVSGAVILFWAVSMFIKSTKIEKSDFLRLAACGLFGVAVNQLFFFWGLDKTIPINASIIMTTNPILVLIISSVLIGERITYRKIGGIILAACGAIYIFTRGSSFSLSSETLVGDLFILINAASYGIYLVIVKPLMYKYDPLTVIKWVFTFGLIYVIPVGFSQFSEIDWNFPLNIWLSVLFIVIGTTFFAYLLNVFALKRVSPTVVSSYIYLQPVLATIFALMLGADAITWQKVISALLIFAGVYLVSTNYNDKLRNKAKAIRG